MHLYLWLDGYSGGTLSEATLWAGAGWLQTSALSYSHNDSKGHTKHHWPIYKASSGFQGAIWPHNIAAEYVEVNPVNLWLYYTSPVFKLEVCTCISMWRASKQSHFTQTFKLFVKQFTKKTWCWPFCIKSENKLMSHYIEEVHAIKWCTKLI
jgi:hypothetical protein